MSDLGKLSDLMGALAEAFPRDYAGAVSLVRQIANEERERCFDEARSPDGVPWAPLSPATVRQKQRRGYPASPLVRTGALREGETSYGLFQSRGTRTIPARPFEGISEQAADRMAEAVADWAREQLLKGL